MGVRKGGGGAKPGQYALYSLVMEAIGGTYAASRMRSIGSKRFLLT